MKIRDAIAIVKNNLNVKNQDDRISNRFVFSVLLSVAKTFISRKLNELRLRGENLYKQEKVKLKKVDVVTCDIMEFRTCNKVMKSIKPLDNLIYYNGGASVRLVSNLDNSIRIEKTDLRKFMRDKSRQVYDDNKPYYYIDGQGYLYLVNTESECVLVDRIKLGVDYSDCKKSALEQEFNVPSKLENDIFQAAIQEISIQKQIPTDENANLDSRT